MRILDRYVAREFTRLFVLFVIAVPVMLTIFDITEQLGKFLEENLPARQIALGYVYQFPLFVLYAFPIAALIATVFTVNGMTRNSEVAAAKAAGVSFFRLMAPLPLLGLILTAGALVLAEVVPVANRMRAEVLGEKERVRSSRMDFVYRTKEGHVFAIRRLDVASGRIFGIAMERRGSELPGRDTVAANAVDAANGAAATDAALRWDAPTQGAMAPPEPPAVVGPERTERDGRPPQERSAAARPPTGRGPGRAQDGLPRPALLPTLQAAAEEATYEPGTGWFLERGHLRILEGSEERAIQFARMLPARFSETPDELLAEPKDPDEMRYQELRQFIGILQRTGTNPLKLMVDLDQKIAIPVATLIIVLFAAPLAVTAPRGGPAYGVGISLAITIFYLLLFKVFGAAGATGAIPPRLAAWLPNLLFAAAAAVLTIRVRT